MDPFFTDLGRTVLARWKKQNFALAQFPDIAQEILEARPPATHVDASSLVREFLLEDEQPFQTQSGFGQPELVVYDDPRFYIQILFWLEGTTDIHQHKFSGAFHVFEGSSIHAHFDFEKPRPISAHFRVGQLRMKDIQLLETGSTVPIVSGRGYIHALFHLEMPSLTVVVRTHTDPGTGPQFTYLAPHLAVDPFFNDALTTRRKQLLDVLEKLEDPSYPALVREMLGELDFERGFFILQNGVAYLRSLGEWEETWQVFRKKHGELAKYVTPTLEEIGRRDQIVSFRSSITEEEHRFFLALLLNVPRREDILEFVTRRFDGSAVETILRWAEELGNTSKAGTWILDAEFPAEVAISAARKPEVFQTALGYFLARETGRIQVGSRFLTATEIEKLRAAFARSCLRALVV